MKLTRQETFDKVAKHLLTQMKQARKPLGDCMYRTPDGLKCAVGCLIPDKLYDEDFEGQTVRGVFESYPGIMQKVGITRANLQLLAKLQRVHDDGDPKDWEEALKTVAADGELKWREELSCIRSRTD